ncbi:MAG: FHA domain-containing protein [Bacillota bacterium]
MMIDIYKSNGKTFYKLKLSEKKLDNGKYKMFTYNKLKSFVYFEKMYIEDKMYLIYETEEYIKLKDFILKEKLLFKEVLVKLKNCLNELKNYFLLKKEDIILNLDYIFIDPLKKDIKLFYVPKKNIAEDSIKFTELIYSLISLYEKDKYYSKTINKTKSILNSNKNINFNYLEKLISSSKNKFKEEKIKNKEKDKKEIIVNKDDEKNKDQIRELDKDENKQTETINLVIRSVCIFIIAFLIYRLLNNIFIFNNLYIKLIISVFIITGSLISLYYLGFDEVLNKNISKKIEQEIFSQEKARSFDNEGIMESKTFLIHNNKKIIIDQDQFIIGRDFNKSDYQINDPSISLLNTEILKKDGNFFIRDLNSTNGTILNNRKLESNNLNKLYSKDIFKVSNHKFKYINEN